MRSEKIHRALAQGMNRFQVCRLAAKGVRATHKTGSRFEDTINDTLDFLGNPGSANQPMQPAPQEPLLTAASPKVLSGPLKHAA